MVLLLESLILTELMCDDPLNLSQALRVQIPTVRTQYEIDLYSVLLCELIY